jgi:hypothetical protein
MDLAGIDKRLWFLEREIKASRKDIKELTKAVTVLSEDMRASLNSNKIYGELVETDES